MAPSDIERAARVSSSRGPPPLLLDLCYKIAFANAIHTDIDDDLTVGNER